MCICMCIYIYIYVNTYIHICVILYIYVQGIDKSIIGRLTATATKSGRLAHSFVDVAYGRTSFFLVGGKIHIYEHVYVYLYVFKYVYV
jgi:hypothetical protein